MMCGLTLSGLAAACAPVVPSSQPINPGAPLAAHSYGLITTQDGLHGLNREKGNQMGLLAPDLNGQYTLIPGGPRPVPPPRGPRPQKAPSPRFRPGKNGLI